MLWNVNIESLLKFKLQLVLEAVKAFGIELFEGVASVLAKSCRVDKLRHIDETSVSRRGFIHRAIKFVWEPGPLLLALGDDKVCRLWIVFRQLRIKLGVIHEWRRAWELTVRSFLRDNVNSWAFLEGVPVF